MVGSVLHMGDVGYFSPTMSVARYSLKVIENITFFLITTLDFSTDQGNQVSSTIWVVRSKIKMKSDKKKKTLKTSPD